MLIAILIGVFHHNVCAYNYFSDTILTLSADTVDSSTTSPFGLVPAVDSVLNDSNKLEDKTVERMESTFRSKVTYHGNDSIMLDHRNNKAYMWGEAWVKYEGIELKADYLEIDFEKSEVIARGLPDSAGVMKNMPVFTEKGQEYKSAEMVYNFQSKKGLITKITTQESSGYIHGDRVKMASDNVFYIRNGKYTTCSLDHPHYYVQSNKLKIINNDKIVTGPAYLAVQDVPTFLAVPFGFFPNQDERTSGILIPAIGSTQSLGFALTDGGYYFGFSDQFDLKLLGDVYSNGSWSGRAVATYRQRYKRSGQFDFKYTNRKNGVEGTPSYSKTESYFVDWTHNQDPKARPNSDFSAVVHLGSSNYYQNDFNTSDNNYLRNEFSSNVTYSQRINNSPFTLKLNAGHNQNNQDSTFYIKVPEVTLNMARVFPFKRKMGFGKDKWYEKVGITYSGAFKNQLTTTFEELGTPDNFKNMENGVKQNVTASTNVKLGYINMTPSVSYAETWYFKSYTQNFESGFRPGPENVPVYYQEIVKDTTNGFNRFGDLNLNVAFTTKMYGIYSIKNSRVKAIRHTMTPTIGATYKPNLSKLHPEYFGEVATDTLGNTKTYSIFEGSVYGVPNGSEFGNINFGLQNIVEMKHLKKSDTTGTYTNVNLVDAWNFNTSYNMLADSFNWAPLVMQVRSRIGKNIVWNANTTSDFYGIRYREVGDSEGVTELKPQRSKEFYYNQTGIPLRLTKFETSFGINLSGKSTADDKKKKEVQEINPEVDPNAPYLDQQYLDFNIPWDLSINYKFTYSKPLDEGDIVNSLTFNGSINLTPGWKIRMRSSYDFELKSLGYTSMDIVRDLHCWQIDLNVIPFGDRKSFRINIRVKQGFLQDLKLTKNNRWFDG